MGNDELRAGAAAYAFEVRQIGIAEDPTTETLSVGFAENTDGTGRVLIFSLRLAAFDDDDIRHGWDTYCITNEGAAVVYGGVTSCVLDRDVLALEFSDEAANTLTLDAACRFRLLVDPRTMQDLRTALRRVLTGGRHHRGTPSHLQV